MMEGGLTLSKPREWRVFSLHLTKNLGISKMMLLYNLYTGISIQKGFNAKFPEDLVKTSSSLL